MTPRRIGSKYSEKELLDGLKNQDRLIIRFFYEEYYTMIVDLINRNSGTDEEARDTFQEAMMVLYEKACDPEFSLSSTLKTYLYSICRNKWLMVLRSRKTRNTFLTDTEDLSLTSDENILKDVLQHERYQLMRSKLKSLGDDCQQVLELFFKGTSLREIGQRLGFTEAYAKKKKFTCQKKLIALVTEDDRYQELKS